MLLLMKLVMVQIIHTCGWLPDPTLGFSGGGIDDCGYFGSSSACPAPHPNYGTIELLMLEDLNFQIVKHKH